MRLSERDAEASVDFLNGHLVERLARQASPLMRAAPLC